ncbi:MAG: hypothetical protein OHK0015_34300 [Chloroflexi bacterium OHK40]
MAHRADCSGWGRRNGRVGAFPWRAPCHTGQSRHGSCNLLRRPATKVCVLQRKEATMAGTWDVIKGKWNQLKGEARIQWGKLTDDDWDQIAGNRDKLVGRLQERYGWEKIEAERQVDDYFRRYDDSNTGR